MKKWFFILVAIAVGFNFGWRYMVDYFAKKGVPRSHIVGYLIYRDKYIGQNKANEIKANEENNKKAAEKEKKVAVVKIKTVESVTSEYRVAMSKAISEAEKADANMVYYREMSKVEKDPVKMQEWRNKYIDVKAAEFAKSNAEVQYTLKITEYNDIKKKIDNYRKNGIRPPSKLIALQKNKPDKEKIYKELYFTEKKRLEGSVF